MSKGVKIIALIASLLIFFGIITAVTGVSMGGLNSLILGSNGLQVSFTDETTGQANINKQLEAFDSIEIKLNAYRIILTEGDEYCVKVVSNSRMDQPYISVVNGALKINEYADMSGDNSKWRNLINRTILNTRYWGWFSSFNSWGFDIPTITVVYPKNKRFDSVDIRAAATSVQLRNLNSDSLQVNCDAGDVRLYDTDVDKLKINLAAGNCDLQNVSAGNSIITLNAGSFSASRFTCEGLNCGLDMGSAEISGVLRGNIAVRSNMGSVNLYSDLSEDDYSISANAVMGRVLINGFGGDGEMRGGRKDAANHMEIKTNMGSVTINFAR